MQMLPYLGHLSKSPPQMLHGNADQSGRANLLHPTTHSSGSDSMSEAAFTNCSVMAGVLGAHHADEAWNGAASAFSFLDAVHTKTGGEEGPSSADDACAELSAHAQGTASSSDGLEGNCSGHGTNAATGPVTAKEPIDDLKAYDAAVQSLIGILALAFSSSQRTLQASSVMQREWRPGLPDLASSRSTVATT